MTNKPLTEMNECYQCKHKGDVPGSAHSSCNKPDKKMTGDIQGRRRGWFVYPHNFDPVWKTRMCVNFEQK